MIIKDFNQVYQLAGEMGPRKMAVLAPEDIEFLKSLKHVCKDGLIEAVFIGDQEKMKIAADQADFDLDSIEKIYASDYQKIANQGVAMLFNGEVDIVGKGRIPTSFIYRAVINEEKTRGKMENISVISLWETPAKDHLIAITDSGVNILPDYKTKKEILKTALFVMLLLGYTNPQVVILSAQRKNSPPLVSYTDAQKLREEFSHDAKSSCTIRPEHSLAQFFGEKEDNGSLPHIVIVPDLDTGNILVKLDYMLNVIRCTIGLSSKGPLIIPSRADFCDSIIREISLGVFLAAKIKEENICYA